MKFRIVRFIVGIVGLIVIIQVLTAIYFSSKHWPEDHPGINHVGRSVGNPHVGPNKQVRFVAFVSFSSVSEFQISL